MRKKQRKTVCSANGLHYFCSVQNRSKGGTRLRQASIFVISIFLFISIISGWLHVASSPLVNKQAHKNSFPTWMYEIRERDSWNQMSLLFYAYVAQLKYLQIWTNYHKETLVSRSFYLSYASLIPRPLPDFILQPWRKIGCEIKSGSGLGTRLAYAWISSATQVQFGQEIAVPISQSPQGSWWGLVLAETGPVQWVTLHYIWARCSSLIVHVCLIGSTRLEISSNEMMEFEINWSIMKTLDYAQSPCKPV